MMPTFQLIQRLKNIKDNIDFFIKSETNQIFYIIEIESQSHIIHNRKKAIKQLSNTIDYFDLKLDKNYCGLILEAYVSTPPSYPRHDTAWVNLEVEFLEEYGIPLFETNNKIFD